MTKKVINYEEAKRLLQAQVDKKGEDFVYRSDPDFGTCVNWREAWNGERVPDCIVGHVIHDLGLLDLVDCDAGASTTLDILALHGVVATEKARALFRHVQVLQDSGMPWGSALTLSASRVESILAYRHLSDEVAA